MKAVRILSLVLVVAVMSSCTTSRKGVSPQMQQYVESFFCFPDTMASIDYENIFYCKGPVSQSSYVPKSRNESPTFNFGAMPAKDNYITCHFTGKSKFGDTYVLEYMNHGALSLESFIFDGKDKVVLDDNNFRLTLFRKANSLPPKQPEPVAKLFHAIQATSELRVGKSETDAKAIIRKYGISPCGASGGTSNWSLSSILSDKSQLVLDFRYQSRDLRERGPSELIGWRVLDPSGELLPKFSLYEPPGSSNEQRVIASLAGEKDEAKWWYSPKTNAVPLNAVELLLVYQEPRETELRAHRQLRGRLLLRFKNVGTNTIDRYGANHLFDFGALFLSPPTGTNLQCHIPKGGVVSCNPAQHRLAEIRDITSGDQCEYLRTRPVYEWFPAMTNSADGIYKVWWQVEDKKSNVIAFRKDKNGIERIEEDDPLPPSTPAP